MEPLSQHTEQTTELCTPNAATSLGDVDGNLCRVRSWRPELPVSVPTGAQLLWWQAEVPASTLLSWGWGKDTVLTLKPGWDKTETYQGNPPLPGFRKHKDLNLLLDATRLGQDEGNEMEMVTHAHAWAQTSHRTSPSGTFSFCEAGGPQKDQTWLDWWHHTTTPSLWSKQPGGHCSSTPNRLGSTRTQAQMKRKEQRSFS